MPPRRSTRLVRKRRQNYPYSIVPLKRRKIEEQDEDGESEIESENETQSRLADEPNETIETFVRDETSDNVEAPLRETGFELDDETLNEMILHDDETIVEEDSIISRETEPRPSYSFRFRTSRLHVFVGRQNPLPPTMFTDSDDLWQELVATERNPVYRRDVDLMIRHPELEPRMRSVLIDWLSEVSEVYKLQRETFYLAVDYIDRYLGLSYDVKRPRLQLVGTTALFIASKYEEIYPQRLKEFSDIADGACPESHILEQEKEMLMRLSYNVKPTTPLLWLTTYLQVMSFQSDAPESDKILISRFPPKKFIQIMRIIDVCILDIGSLQWSYSILAASALYHSTVDKPVSVEATGYQYVEIAPCVRWMEPFALTVLDQHSISMRSFDGVPRDDSHNIQTHSVDLNLLEAVQIKKIQLESSPDQSNILPTPPESEEGKSRRILKAHRKNLPINIKSSLSPVDKSPGKENEFLKNQK